MSGMVLARRAVDVMMTALLLILMAHPVMNGDIHEILGVVVLALFVIHHVLNRGWYRTAFSGKRDPARSLRLAIDLLLLIALAGTAISSVLVSRDVFSFVHARGGLPARKLHAAMTGWCFLLASVHLGFHWGIVTGTAKQMAGGASRRTGKTAARIAAAAVSAYGVFACITHDIGAKLTMYYGYSYWDAGAGRFLFFVDLLAIMGLYAGAGYYLLKLIQRVTARAAVSSSS